VDPGQPPLNFGRQSPVEVNKLYLVREVREGKEMEDARVGEKGWLLAWGREGIRSLSEGFPVRIAGHGLRLILGTAIGLLFLALALRGVSWSQVRNALTEANYPLLALALGTVLVTTLAKAARWRLLFPQEYSKPRLGKLFSVLLIGQTVNASTSRQKSFGGRGTSAG
jgi:hypothetical protein